MYVYDYIHSYICVHTFICIEKRNKRSPMLSFKSFVSIQTDNVDPDTYKAKYEGMYMYLHLRHIKD